MDALPRKRRSVAAGLVLGLALSAGAGTQPGHSLPQPRPQAISGLVKSLLRRLSVVLAEQRKDAHAQSTVPLGLRN